MAAAKKAAVPVQTPAEKAIGRFLAKMDKSYGAGKFMAGAKPSKYEVISTGSLSLDRALVVGGYVKGRTIEIWGPEGAGKSTLAMIAAAQAQLDDPDKFVLYVDAEHRADVQWMISHGMDMTRCVLVRPSDAEEVADMVKDACREGSCSMVIVDSIGAMIPAKEKEKAAEDAVVGMQAKIVTRMVKICAPEADVTGTVVVFINQVRAAIGAYGQDTTSGGGYALKHGTTMKLEVRRTSGGQIKLAGGDKQQVGHLMTVKVERNSVALAYRKAEFSLLYVTTAQYGPMGIDRADEAAKLGVEFDIVEQSGSWYTCKITGERMQGMPAVVEHMRKYPDVLTEVRRRVIEALAADVVGDESVPAAEPDELSFDAPAPVVPSGE
jgi:recombination protein RecA